VDQLSEACGCDAWAAIESQPGYQVAAAVNEATDGDISSARRNGARGTRDEEEHERSCTRWCQTGNSTSIRQRVFLDVQE